MESGRRSVADDDESNTPHQKVIHTYDHLPGPMGGVVKEMAKIQPDADMKVESYMFDFLEIPLSLSLELNSKLLIMSVIIPMPLSNMDQVLHGLGYGTRKIGGYIPLQMNIITLTGG